MSADQQQKQNPLFERVQVPEIPKDTAKQIARLEGEFVRAEVENLRNSAKIFAPLYEKRSHIINTPNVQSDFWIRAFSNAPAEIDEYILPSDAAALGSLKNLTVERFELDAEGNGEPRSLRFIFEFRTGEENPFFENEKLVKDFYWRKQSLKTAKGKRRSWEGLVSEPVRIHWKKDMDLTKGVLSAACDLADAEKKNQGKPRKDLVEFEKLVEKVGEVEAETIGHSHGADDDEDEDEDHDHDSLAGQSPAGLSFFAWFGYRGRDVSAEQSKEAFKESEERWAKIAKGEKVDDDEDDNQDDDDEEPEDELENAEIFPDGENLAISIAEDLWPGALKYYVQSYELADDLSELDFDEDDDDEEDAQNGEDEKSHPRKRARV